MSLDVSVVLPHRHRLMEAPETVGVVIGNHTQKYTARNPAIRWLTERCVANLDRSSPGSSASPWAGRWRSAAARG